MGFWSDLCSGVSKALSPVVNAVSNVLQNSELMQKLLPVLGLVIPPPWDVVAVIAVQVLSAAMGKPENPEELGWQMNEADKKPEDFNSFDEYREYLNEKYPFDKDAFDAQTDEQKAACRYVGMAGTMQELKESKGFEINAASLGALAGMASTLGWSNDTMKSFTNGMLSSLGGPGFNMLGDYVKGNLGAEDMGKVEKGIDNGLSEANVNDSRSGVVSAREASLQEQ